MYINNKYPSMKSLLYATSCVVSVYIYIYTLVLTCSYIFTKTTGCASSCTD